MNTFKTAMLSLVLVAAVSPVQALTGRFGAQIRQVDENIFEVVGQNSAASGWEYWCGAAEYARRALNADWSDRIYVVRGRGRSVTSNRRSAVHFTLNPDILTSEPVRSFLILKSLQVGDNMTVQRANTECQRPPARL
jgi:hypothetical protein